jgi:hypothetical protein
MGSRHLQQKEGYAYLSLEPELRFVEFSRQTGLPEGAADRALRLTTE